MHSVHERKYCFCTLILKNCLHGSRPVHSWIELVTSMTSDVSGDKIAFLMTRLDISPLAIGWTPGCLSMAISLYT